MSLSKWGQGVFFPTHPDLANIFGDMDFDFDNCHVDVFWVSEFPGSQISKLPEIWLGQPDKIMWSVILDG